MRFIEIRLSNGLLLVGSPGAFPGVMNKAADQQQLRSVLRSFPRNSAAMGQLRRQWRRLYPAQSSATLPAQEMVRLLGRELAAARLAAAFLRDAPCNIAEARFSLGAGPVVHVPMAGFTLLIASKGQLPPEFNRYRNNRGGAAMLRQVAQNDPAAAAIDNQAARLPGGTVKRITGLPLRQHLAWAIESGAHDCAILDQRIAISQAAARPDAPRDVMQMSSAEKIGEAMSRSTKHLRGDVLVAVEAMVEPEALVIMAGGFAAVALAQLNPVSGAAVDTAIVALAWYSAGLAGVLALSDFIDATITATGAASEAELNEAAKSYSKAFVALGAMLLEAMMAKFLSKKGGKSGDKGGGGGSGGGGSKGAKTAGNDKTPGNAGSSPAKSPPRFGKRSKSTEPGARRADAKTLREIRRAKLRKDHGPLKKAGWSDIPGDHVKTFKSYPEPVELKPGQKIYRVLDSESNPNGGYWTTENPAKMTEADWRSGAAVKGEWNGDGAYVEYEVPKEGLKVWSGEAAPQMSSDGKSVLGGGGNQMWIAQDKISATHVSPDSVISTGWSN